MIHDFYFDAHESKVIEIHSHHKVYQEIFMNVILKIFCKNLAYKNENDPTKIISPYCEIVAITVVSSSIIGTLPNLQKCHLAHWSDYNDELYLALSNTGFRVSIKGCFEIWFESRFSWIWSQSYIRRMQDFPFESK